MQFSHHLQPWAARKGGEVILVYNGCSVPRIYSKFPVAREADDTNPAWERIENAQDSQFSGYSLPREDLSSILACFRPAYAQTPTPAFIAVPCLL